MIRRRESELLRRTSRVRGAGLAPLLWLLACGGATIGDAATGDVSDSIGAASSGSSATVSESASSSGSTTNHTTETGMIPLCGNGEVDLDEHCDGIPVYGNSCPASCRFEAMTELWAVQVDGDGRNDRCRDVSMSRQGDIYIAGTTEDDAFLVSLEQSGEEQWVRAREYVSNGRERLVGVQAIDAGFYVVGRATVWNEADQEQQDSLWTARFSSNGDLVWAREQQASGSGYEIAAGGIRTNGEKVLSFGSEYRFGEGHIPGLVVEYNPTGTLLGATFIDAPSISREKPFGSWSTPTIAKGGGGRSYVVGGESYTTADNFQGLVQRRALDHSLLWELTANDEDSVDDADRIRALWEDASGNVVAAGSAKAVANYDLTLHKFGSDGELIWNRRIPPPATGSSTEAAGVVTDSEGDVYMVGSVDLASTARVGMITIKFSADGEEVWRDIWEGDADHPWSYGSAVGIGPDGFLVIVGYTGGPEQPYDALVRKVVP